MKKKLAIVAIIAAMMLVLCGCTQHEESEMDMTDKFIQETQEYIDMLGELKGL